MAHHKRKRPKHQRAGCLMCKPWKDERVGSRRMSYTFPSGRSESALKASVRRKLQPDE